MEEKVFKTEEERQKAINDIPEEPPADIKGNFEKEEEWRGKTQAEIDAMMNAKIDPGLEVKPDEGVKPEEGVKPDLSKPPELTEADTLKRQLDLYQKERLQMQDEAGHMKVDYETKMQDMDKKMKELEEQIKNPPAPEKPPEDHEMKALESDFNSVAEEMKSINKDEDQDAWDKAVNKKIDIGHKINLLRVKRDNEGRTAFKSEIQQMKANAKKEADEAKKRREQDEEQHQRNVRREDLFREINSFTTEHAEFKSDLTYEQSFHEYDRFAEQVAADYWSKPGYKVDARDKELAMIKYKQKNPMIIESLKKKGITEPKSFKIYDTLSKVVQLKQGYKLNEDTGEFYEYKDGAGNRVVFPDMGAAYDHLQKLTGKRGEELVKATQEGAKGAAAAMSQRANPMELDEGQERQSIETEIKPEEALEMLQKEDSKGELIFDDEKMAALAMEADKAGKPMPTIVREYNKYMKAIGQPAVEETLKLGQ